MEPEQVLAAIQGAFVKGFQQLLGALVSFRTFAQLAAALASMVGGWLRPILYRDAGERALRGSFFAVVFSLLVWGLFCEGWHQAQSWYAHVVSFGGSPVWRLVAVWSVGLMVADWLAALDRRKKQTFIFTRFLGWPRFLPASVASYPLPPVIVLVVGAILKTWKLDEPGGIMLMASAAAMLVQLWVITSLRREDAYDLLDANWLSEDRSRASEALSGTGQGAAIESVARAVTTADLVRRYSI